MVTDGDATRGWVHTHGMANLGLPELEIRHVPSFLNEGAVMLLRDICDYMLESGNAVRPDETMETSPHTMFRFVRAKPIAGAEDHYEAERLLITEVDRACKCCKLKSHELN
jgi:hypothetical protein